MRKMIGRYHYRREATPDQRINKVWEREEIKQVIARRSLYIFNNDRAAELDELWVRESENRRTAQIGSNWGYYVGFDSIKAYYDKAYPAGVDGYFYHIPNSTNIVQIAADGLTAYCVIYALSSQACDLGSGVRGYNVYDRIWFDMKREDGNWKIWHVFTGNDTSVENALNVMTLPALAKKDADRPLNPSQVLFGQPDYPITAFDPSFGWCEFPRVPDSHDSYSLDMSCSLEACLKYQAGVKALDDVSAVYKKLGGDNK